jgi:hypothetical protein
MTPIISIVGVNGGMGVVVGEVMDGSIVGVVITRFVLVTNPHTSPQICVTIG